MAPNPSSYMVQSPVKILHRFATVHELTDENSGEWDRPLLNQIFIPEEAALISSMPLSRYEAADKIYWWPTKDEFFSVKSSYHLEMDRIRSAGESSTRRYQNVGWRAIWKLNVPCIVKHFFMESLS